MLVSAIVGFLAALALWMGVGYALLQVREQISKTTYLQ